MNAAYEYVSLFTKHLQFQNLLQIFHSFIHFYNKFYSNLASFLFSYTIITIL